MRYLVAAFALSALLSAPAFALTLQVTITPTTVDELGNPLPTEGLGSLVSHRVQYGTCSGDVFGSVIAVQVVAMPAVTVSFLNVPAGTYCVRAFASNVYGEGGPYPVVKVGLKPGRLGVVKVIKQ